ncbi:MAG: ABC transporter ATP-binding protein [Thermoleophilia bacterium]|nr:ABC transporter ATP-binding protein [Thermoleophilia bacterium]MDH3725738.1 ABC transporter ATP-binding protein [Thermoleophilia bacterium]
MSSAPVIDSITRRAATGSLRVSGIRKTFGADAVLRGADLRVAAGKTLALLGPSGCGKTTLLRIIAGLESADAGSVALGESELVGRSTNVPAERRGIGMVFQEPALFPHLTVADNVGFGLSRAERRGPRVHESLALVGLDHLADRRPQTLSGGQQQRVALARALAPRPNAVLLDEPFSSLDAPLRAELRVEVRGLLADLGTTAIFVTHDREEALLMGDEVAVMLDGLIEQQGSAVELYDLPCSRSVAEFVGDANLLCGVASGRMADTLIGRVPLSEPAAGTVDVMVRPERVVLSPGGEAVVEGFEFYGHDVAYALRLPCGARLRALELGPPRFSRGDVLTPTYDGDPTVAFTADGCPAVASSFER